MCLTEGRLEGSGWCLWGLLLGVVGGFLRQGRLCVRGNIWSSIRSSLDGNFALIFMEVGGIVIIDRVALGVVIASIGDAIT